MTASYADGASAQPLIGETIGANFDRTVDRHPDVEALISSSQGMRYTYGQLAERVDAEEMIRQWTQHKDEFYVRYRTLYSPHPPHLLRICV